jgi:type IV pilus assembly protein PilA
VFIAIHKRLEDRDEGFTLIELLVVVIIIGILAAIAIPTFLNQRRRGWDAASQSEVRNIALAEESYATSFNGTYTTDLTKLAAEGYVRSTPFNTPGTVAVNMPAGSTTAYCVQVSHTAQPTVFWGMSSSSGAPAKGTCTAGVFTAAT